jgi:hypothetical protein
MVLFLFITNIVAQQDCSITNFEACKEQAKLYLETTCNPLQTNTNVSYFPTCLCYQKYNEGNCYGQCPQNSTIQTEYRSGIVPAIESYCAAVGLDSKRLPYPPIWQTNTQGAVIPTTGTNGNTAAVTVTPRSSQSEIVPCFILSILSLLM